ncbi:hypothetical protein V8C37DRAFT_389082 [Trichoderma ceciliae]
MYHVPMYKDLSCFPCLFIFPFRLLFLSSRHRKFSCRIRGTEQRDRGGAKESTRRCWH